MSNRGAYIFPFFWKILYHNCLKAALHQPLSIPFLNLTFYWYFYYSEYFQSTIFHTKFIGFFHNFTLFLWILFSTYFKGLIMVVFGFIRIKSSIGWVFWLSLAALAFLMWLWTFCSRLILRESFLSLHLPSCFLCTVRDGLHPASLLSLYPTAEPGL